MKLKAGKANDLLQGTEIDRPRLTRLLDDTGARVILLLAPAGYGKTTLARTWLSDRAHAWYRGDPGSGDVAALALGIARTCSVLAPHAGERLRERLRISRSPAAEVESLADLLAEDLHEWPQEAWIAFDDYQFACDSEPAERLIEALLSRCRVRLLIASRSRPHWATARRALYGEVFEIGRSLLAMTPDEAVEVLRGRRINEVDALLSVADGWPALLGLAAVATSVTMPGEAVADELYAFFAEELYSAAKPHVQQALRRLALAPYVIPEIADIVIRGEGREVLAEGVELGFLTQGSHDRFDFHPLLRLFLSSKFRQRIDDPTGALVADLARLLIDLEEWDAVFALATKLAQNRVLIRLLEAALEPMLDQARLPTVALWLHTASSRGLDSPLIDLGEAELAFRRGELHRAEAVACQAARRFEEGHALKSRALWIAGTSAHLIYRDEAALQYFVAADKASVLEEDRRESLWGQFVTTESMEREEDAAQLLTRFKAVSGTSVDELLRIATAESRMAKLAANIQPALEDHGSLSHLVYKSRNPVIRSSFANTYIALLVISAQYENAVLEAEKQINFAMEYSLDFVLPFTHLLMSSAQLGLRRFRECKTSLTACEKSEITSNFAKTNLLLMHARVYLSTQRVGEALNLFEDSYSVAKNCRAMQAEYLAWWSLAHALAGNHREATALSGQATRCSHRIEVSALVPWVRAVVAVREGRTGDYETAEAFRITKRSGNADAFVHSYRACPQILHLLGRNPENRDMLKEILRRANDRALAASTGLRFQSGRNSRGSSLLTNREREVIDLVAQGLTNKEIGRALYITEATVKVHVRKICQKLGARGRTEAAMRAAELSG